MSEEMGAIAGKPEGAGKVEGEENMKKKRSKEKTPKKSRRETQLILRKTLEEQIEKPVLEEKEDDFTVESDDEKNQDSDEDENYQDELDLALGKVNVFSEKFEQPSVRMEESKIRELLREYCKDESYKFKDTNVRNILMVGKTRSGKSTAISTLKTVENLALPLDLFSNNAGVQFQNFSLKEDGKADYNFNVIDTPGLFEVVSEGKTARSNDKILEMISECLKNEITKIHAIVLFCSISEGLNLFDVEALKTIINCFGQDTNMVIVITRAENLNKIERDGYIDKLKTHSELKEIIKIVKNRIVFMGAIDPKNVTSEQVLKEYTTRIKDDRKLLLNFLFACKKHKNISKLLFVKKNKKSLGKRLSTLLEEAQTLDKMEKIDGDFERRYYILNQEFKDMNVFFKMFDESAARKYSEIYTCLKVLHKKLPPRTS